jgi:hypothetical protein
VRRKIGEYVYDEEERKQKPAFKDVVKRPPYVFDNNAIYIGEWSLDGLRQGKGMQMWSDGSIYEGFWEKDMANGKGRLI